jgi:hypothetical protein
MQVEGFVDGLWSGYYVQLGRHPMKLHLQFQDGRVSGHGSDNVGPFSIDGAYNAGTLDCSWFKRYEGAHTVHYEGRLTSATIEGKWKIGSGGWLASGAFVIWPGAQGALSEGVPFV